MEYILKGANISRGVNLKTAIIFDIILYDFIDIFHE